MSSFLGESGPEWRPVEQIPVEDTLFDVVHTADGPYAVGESGTLVANRTNDDGWDVIVSAGPATENNKLTATSVTSDGKRIWFLGYSGSLGCFDVTTGKKYDYSFPKGMTSSWQALTVGGKAGSEIALAANGSGEVLPFALDGFEVDWGTVTKPMAGASITAIGSNSETAYAVDTSGNVYKTTPKDGWVKVGIPSAKASLRDVWVGENQRVYVAADDGNVYRYDDSARDWTPIDVAQAALQAVDLYEDQIVVISEDGSIYQRTTGGDRWSKTHSPVNTTLYGLDLGHPDIAVGKSGTILVRQRPGSSGTSGASGDTNSSESGDRSPLPAGKTEEGDAETKSGSKSPTEDESQSKPADSGSGSGSTGDSTTPSSDGETEKTPPADETGKTAPAEETKTPSKDESTETTDVLQFPEFEDATEESADHPVLAFPEAGAEEEAGTESEAETKAESDAGPVEYVAENNIVLVLTHGC